MSGNFYSHLEKCAKRSKSSLFGKGLFVGRKGLLIDTRGNLEKSIDSRISKFIRDHQAKRFYARFGRPGETLEQYRQRVRL